MRAINYFSAIFILCSILISCNPDDLCEQTVTYTKAIGIYMDLDRLRSDDINSPARTLISPAKILIKDQYLFIGEKNEGIHVIDNTDPSHPKFVNFLAIKGNREMAVKGDMIYVDAYYDLLEIDVSNPLQAVITRRLKETIPVKLINDRGEAMVGFKYEEVTETMSCNERYNDGQLVWLDYRNIRIPESVIPTSFVSNGNSSFGTANRMAIVDDILFAIDYTDLHMYDIQRGSNFARSTRSIGVNMETIYPHEGRLFIGAQNNMSIYSLADPLNPQFEGSFVHPTSCDPVLPGDNYIAYVTLRGTDDCPGNINSLNVVDYSVVNNPIAIQQISMFSPYAMASKNGLLYVGEGEKGLSIFEISTDGTVLWRKRDFNITAYDIIPHPIDDSIMLIAGPHGISQYQVASEEFTLISEIAY